VKFHGARDILSVEKRYLQAGADAIVRSVRPLLLSAVEVLAASPDEQRAVIGDGTVDDLALDLDAPPWHDESEETCAALAQLRQETPCGDNRP
jgi:hypothetical protein